MRTTGFGVLSKRPPWRRLVAFTAAVLVTGSLLGGAESQPDVDERLEDETKKLELLNEKLGDLEGELSQLDTRKTTLLGELHRLDLQARVATEQLELLGLELKRGYRAIDENLERIEGLEGSIEELKPHLAGRSASLYKLGRLSYVRMLLSVDNPSELTRAYRYISRLAQEDGVQMKRFIDQELELQATKAELLERTELMLTTREQLEGTKRTLSRRRASRNALLEEVASREEMARTLVFELEDAREALGDLIEQLSTGEILAGDIVHLPMRAFEGEIGWPVEGDVQGRFGKQLHPRFKTVTVRNGVEIEASVGAPVTAVYDGEVAFASWFQGYGKLLIIRHPGQVHTLYGFLSDFVVAPGDRVDTGQAVAYVGETGSMDGPRLYFEIRVDGAPTDPEGWLDPERRLASRTTSSESEQN